MKPVDIDPAILEQAAGWLVQIHSGEASPVNNAEIEQWRAQSEQHEVAWQRAQQFLQTVHQIPADVGKPALQREVSPARRRAIKKLALMLALGPAVWQTWKIQPWVPYTSDYHTVTGEQHEITLADGTKLILNTATSIDVAYDERQRLVLLRQGEIHVTTAADPSGLDRPFRVQSRDGVMRALGTRFSVRQQEHATHLAVFESAVEIMPHQVTLYAGQQVEFSDGQVAAIGKVHKLQESWTQGMLVVHDQPLAAVIAELRRYHPGILRCHPDIAGLHVSGTFPLAEVGRSLNLLQATLPIRVNRITPYWVNLVPES